jgi:2-C-methyl-D-erythritol 2,4-cyclodiphosphate synthase
MTSGYRTGFGYDIHALKSCNEGKLMIGGVCVAQGIRPVAHSDGDALVHALIDALLGAIGAGDIGEHFSDQDARYKDISSLLLLDRVKDILLEKKAIIINIDVTVLLEEIKLLPFKQQIQTSLASHLGLETSSVNVKAKTKEHLDATGRGEAFEAYAAVLIKLP